MFGTYYLTNLIHYYIKFKRSYAVLLVHGNSTWIIAELFVSFNAPTWLLELFFVSIWVQCIVHLVVLWSESFLGLPKSSLTWMHSTWMLYSVDLSILLSRRGFSTVVKGIIWSSSEATSNSWLKFEYTILLAHFRTNLLCHSGIPISLEIQF